MDATDHKEFSAHDLWSRPPSRVLALYFTLTFYPSEEKLQLCIDSLERPTETVLGVARVT